tara:strand:+ start:74104 stop:74781 length:678 start_codon:yes stop_codon:yes gene_type:complete
MVIGLFLVLCGLFLWVFKGPFNIFDYQFADLGNFFFLAPWIFLFLIPAITMKSFSEEKKLGTLELLLIKPLTVWQLVLGKFFGNLVLTLVALLPTLLYVYTVSQLGTTVGNLDIGMVIGSYFGIIFLAACYTAIGLFASTLSENQIVSFIAAVLICFFLYYGFEALASIISSGDTAVFVQRLGMKAHFASIARGVIDSADLLYFLSLALFFLFLAVVQLKTNHNR